MRLGARSVVEGPRAVLRGARAGALACGCGVLVLVAGCSEPASSQPSVASATRASRTATPSPTPDPVQTCISQVTYWVGEALRESPDQGLDYQEMGLSDATYQVVRSVTRELRRTGSSDPAEVVRLATAGCRALPTSTPTGDVGGWP